MFKLIPRVRVNYTLADLIRGLFGSRKIGIKCELLRDAICKYFNVEDVILTSSGRASIYLLLKYLPQSKVVVPAYTCKVVVEAAMLAGKRVIYAPTRSSFNISALPDLDSDTIVIATHQYGIPCDMDMIMSKCRSSGAVVIEDCAGSLGTKLDGKLTGLFGDYAIFSFDSSKMITVPSKGGFIIAKDSKNLQEVRSIAPKGQCSITYKYKHLLRGGIYLLLKSSYIYRCFHYLTMGRKGRMQLEDHKDLDTSLGEFYTHGFYDWQAVIALRQINNLNVIINRRQMIYSYYDRYIINPLIEKPNNDKEAACIRYAILTKNKKNFYEKCLKLGVDMGFSFNNLACPPVWEIEHDISEDVLNLPFYFNLTDMEMKQIVNTINSIK